MKMKTDEETRDFIFRGTTEYPNPLVPISKSLIFDLLDDIKTLESQCNQWKQQFNDEHECCARLITEAQNARHQAANSFDRMRDAETDLEQLRAQLTAMTEERDAYAKAHADQIALSEKAFNERDACRDLFHAEEDKAKAARAEVELREEKLKAEIEQLRRFVPKPYRNLFCK